MKKVKLTLWIDKGLLKEARKILTAPPKKSVSLFLEEQFFELINKKK